MIKKRLCFSQNNTNCEVHLQSIENVSQRMWKLPKFVHGNLCEGKVAVSDQSWDLGDVEDYIGYSHKISTGPN